ncbi:OmpW/AlkL family protein [Halomonas cupida]|uniref:OmpW/AlkL family protein n=1 Tax=Halomonas cupida TaxID=44933 RepID=UPI003A95364D
MRHPLASPFLIAAVASSALVSSQAMAYGKGDFFTRVGVAKVVPKSDSGDLVHGALEASIDEDSGFAYTIGYRFHDKFGVELLAAAPFEHGVNLEAFDGSDIGADVDSLPPTLTLQYYPLGGLESRVQPFFGLGVNYTHFSDERIDVKGADLELDDSWGAAAQMGVDLIISDHWAATTSITYADIDSDVELDGEDIGSVDVDPVVVMGGISFYF